MTDKLNYIEFRHVYKTFDRPVLVDASFFAAAGETLAIVDRAYILNEGRIEVSGTAHEVLESPIARTFYLGEGFRL